MRALRRVSTFNLRVHPVTDTLLPSATHRSHAIVSLVQFGLATLKPTRNARFYDADRADSLPSPLSHPVDSNSFPVCMPVRMQWASHTPVAHVSTHVLYHPRSHNAS